MRYVFLLEWLDETDRVVALVIYLIKHRKDHDSNHMAQGPTCIIFLPKNYLWRGPKSSKQLEIMTALCGTLKSDKFFSLKLYN